MGVVVLDMLAESERYANALADEWLAELDERVQADVAGISGDIQLLMCGMILGRLSAKAACNPRGSHTYEIYRRRMYAFVRDVLNPLITKAGGYAYQLPEDCDHAD